MTTAKLQKWVRNLPIEDYVDLALFYVRLCKVCGEVDKK